MSTAGDTRALIVDLQTRRETGCLTVESVDGRTCHVYLLAGRIFHAEGPTGVGESALSDATSWPAVTLTFDPKAQLPSHATIDAALGGGASQAVSGHPALTRLSEDPRLNLMGCATLGGGCLFVVLPLTLAVLAGLLRSDPAVSTGLFSATLISLPVLLVTWIALHVGFRFTFYRDAVSLPGMSEGSVQAPAAAISGEPELVLQFRARSSAGNLGACSIALYANELAISTRGEPVPRWRFAYGDVLQAESVDVVTTSTRGNSAHQTFVRLITDHPPMTFLFGNFWWWPQNDKARQLITKLHEHGVTTFVEDLET